MERKLKEYNKKRDFNKTAEPKGKKVEQKNKKKLIFVVQHHLARKDHYDFRLEWNNVLLSWAVPKGPSFNPKDKRLAIHVEDHPLSYATFEGTIPKGEYGGGTVMLWDKGTWLPLQEVEQGLKEGGLKFTIHGKRLNGNWKLVKLKDAKDNAWMLIKGSDEFSKEHSGIDDFSTSIKTLRTMEEITNGVKAQKALKKSKENVSVNNKKGSIISAKKSNQTLVKNPFDKVDVKLLTLSNKVPSGDEWIFELKHDGYRMVSFVEKQTARLVSRNNKDYTKHFKSIVDSLLLLAGNSAMVLDGEIVVTNQSGLSDFQLLQNHIKNAGKIEPTYIVFDILALNGDDLRNKPLIERRKILKELLKKSKSNLVFSQQIRGDGNKIFEAACSIKCEGIVAKRKNSKYNRFRNEDWQKIKCGNRQEFVVGGYTVSDKKTSGISALLLGYYKKGNLVFAGKTGTGFTTKMRQELEQMLKKLLSAKSPFYKKESLKEVNQVFFVKPVLVVEVEFAGWTDSKVLRHASYKGLRQDKDAKQVKIEINTKANDKQKDKTKKEKINLKNAKDITITSPQKLMFENPDITKSEVADYYLKVSEKMMPYIKDRVVSLKRCPKGTGSECFFERNYNTKKEGVVAVAVKASEGEKSYISIANVKGLINEVQFNTIEFHTWGSTIKKIEKPDIMVFDLDPDEGMGLDKVRQGVKDLKSILDKLGLKSFLKTSGGKGYHILVPFASTPNWDIFHDFSKKVATFMEQTWPDRYTTNIRKINRKNKIFVDFARNRKSATSVAPYSLRVRKNATVSMPIKWSELDKIAPDGITIKNALEKIKKQDPWKGFFAVTQKLT